MQSVSVRGWRRAIPLIWIGVVAVGVVFVMVTTARADGLGDPVEFVFGAVFLLTPLLLTSLAAIIMRRQPGNRIALLLSIVGAAILVASLLAPWTPDVAPEDPTLANYVASVVSTVIVLPGLFFPLFLIPYIFPTGRFLSKRWSWPLKAIAILLPITLFVSTFTTEMEGPFNSWTMSNPIGFLPPVLTQVLMVLWIGLLWTTALGGVVSIVVRYRRSREEVRAQIRWVAFSVGILVVSFILVNTGIASVNTGAFAVAQALIVSSLPIAITIAITRYRLYEIDRVISRTVGYALLVALLGLIYVAGAVWLPTRLLGDQPPVFTAGSTLAVAALFNPLRHRVIRWVDRRFYRSRFDAEHVMAEFSNRLRDQHDLERLTADSLMVISRTMQPSAVGLWIRE